MNEVEIKNSVIRRTNIIINALAKYENEVLKGVVRIKIAQLLKNVRVLSGYTRTYFADIFDISVQTWTVYESGKKLQPLNIVTAIMLMTGTTVADLLKGTGFYEIVKELEDLNKSGNKEATNFHTINNIIDNTPNKPFTDMQKADIASLGINVAINNVSTDSGGVMSVNNYTLNNIQKVKFLEFLNSLKSSESV